jgi:eukaryotic-like serine/threonine-protein kinase
VGSLLLAQGRLDEAEPYLREALEKRRRVAGEESPSTLMSIRNMGTLLWAQGKSQELIDLFAPAESAARKVYTGGRRQGLAAFLTALGRARAALPFDRERFPLAEANLIEAYPIYSDTRGEKHRSTRDCTQALADLYGKWDTAEPGKGFNAKAAEWKSKLAVGPAAPEKK